MPAGQVLQVVVCSSAVPAGGAIPAGQLLTFGACPPGQNAFLVPSYIPFAQSAQYVDGLMLPFDPQIASGIFSFGFGLVVFFYLLALKGSIILRHFWR
jgi:hypothetical protein